MAVIAVVVASCHVTKISLDLPTTRYSFDTSMIANLPSGSTPAVPCGAGQAVTDCCNPPAPLPAVDCAATPLVCPAAAGGAVSVCTAEVPASVVESMDLGTVPELQSLGSDSLVDVSIQSITYTVTNNSLNVDVPPIVIYLAPNGVTDPTDARAIKFGTVPTVPAGTDPTGMVMLEANKNQTFAMFTHSVSTPFNIIAATTIEIASGTPVPQGHLDVEITGLLSAEL